MRRRQPIVVVVAAQLHDMDRWGPLLSRSAQVDLQIPELARTETSRWEAIINGHLSACGCEEGARGVAMAVVAYGIVVLVSARSLFEWSTVGSGMVVGLCGGVAGKVIGLFRARKGVSRAIRNIEASISASAVAPKGEPHLREG